MRHDIDLSVISKGKTSYYGAYKSVGNIIAETEIGLYSPDLPDSNTLFNDVEGIFRVRNKLKKPYYGYVKIDCDNKLVEFDNGYGIPCQFMASSMLFNVAYALEIVAVEPSLSKSAILSHLQNKRFKHWSGNYKRELVDIGYPQTLSENYDILERMYEGRAINWITVDLPNGWNLKDCCNSE